MLIAVMGSPLSLYFFPAQRLRELMADVVALKLTCTDTVTIRLSGKIANVVHPRPNRRIAG